MTAETLPERIEIEKGASVGLYGGLGYCRYVDHLASDARIVESARVSYKSPSKGAEQDVKLLRYLMKNRHTSPFEQVNMTFNIKIPIFIMRQFVRHRTFRINEWSGRYSELEDQFYVPDVWRAQDEKNKQGSLESGNLDHAKCKKLAAIAYGHSHKTYLHLLSLGVAKEMARIVLPVGIMTEIYVNVDLHNLMHFLKLRLHSHAQKEIRDLAEAMKHFAALAYPETIKAFEDLVLNA